ncbi:MAG: Flp pilus assembly complex ATPase component TadA [Planctomycetes bacterium]|nr:Flp pilus assembly complex ATPase component TadA [Planctomycetota bacterium]
MSEASTMDVGGAARVAIAPLLGRAVAAGASDLHVMAGERPRLRVHGEVEPIEGVGPTSAEDVERLLAEVLPAHLPADGAELDFSHTDAEGRRYRVSAFRERRGRALAFRVLEGRPPGLDDLALPRDILRTIYAPGGLVLFAGHAGAGKTTTLAAVLQAFCERRTARLITLEDPIEYRLAPGLAYVEQREVGNHCGTFAEGLAQATCAQPDAIALGELRDLETIRLALEAAETGVLVFATVHAYDATRTIGRVVDAFDVEERQPVRAALAATLRMIVAQTLLRRRGGRGRVPAVEVVHGCASLSTLIREGKEHELATIIDSSQARGMRALDDALVELVRAGKVLRDDAIAAAVRPEQVARLTG